MYRSLILAAVSACLLCFPGTRAEMQALAPVYVDTSVPSPPVPVAAGGKTLLVYELHATNFSSKEITLTGVDVFGDGATDRPLVRYDRDALASVLTRPGAGKIPDPRVVGGGMRAVVRVWIATDPAAVPTALVHRLTFEVTDAAGAKQSATVEACRVEVSTAKALVLAPPFRGGTWLAGNGPSNTSDHRRTIVAVDGRARVAQRFAIDWVKFGESGLPYHDDPSKNANWFGYGEEVLAVADATVVAVKDGIVENMPLTEQMAVPITLETVAGNHVVLDLGGGRYALYAHLQPGSLRVKVGDRVRRGAVLGLLGNSGNSDAPHLHFHVCDANSPLGCEGLPYALAGFEVLGTVASVDDVLGGKAWHSSPARAPDARHDEIPLENEMVRF
jgi:murein DD-endopeptidase MepM/ murein hydrolase activator NlpD